MSRVALEVMFTQPETEIRGVVAFELASILSLPEVISSEPKNRMSTVRIKANHSYR
jgi:hypothetical protein